MLSRSFRRQLLFVAVLALPMAQAAAAGVFWAAVRESGAPAQNNIRKPSLRKRPPPVVTAKRTEGRIGLDVAVIDGAGRSVKGLQPWDLKLLDNGSPRKILSFRAFSDAGVRPDPPVELILVIDELNLSPQQVAYVRDDLTRFLRRNNGLLDHPVTLMLVSDTGLRVLPKPVSDGLKLLKVVQKIHAHISTISPAMGGDGALEQSRRSLLQIETIAENEADRPGRKLLVWISPGWPSFEGASNSISDRDQRLYFDGIVELTNKLREARIVVNSVAPTDPDFRTLTTNFMYQQYLKGVPSAQQAGSGNLSLKVLATQTGGMILGPDNDVEKQIERCVENADSFYRISFDPPPATRPDEYHELKIDVSQPGITVKTNGGYYD